MRWLSIVLAAASLAACEEGVRYIPTSTGPPAGGADNGGDAPPAVQPLSARAPGRMTVEQLARSIPVVTGGVAWVEDFGQGPVDILEVLSPTLGAPDYLRVTEENLEPTLLIAKFMQDASHRICVRWVEQDAQAALEERTLVGHEDWQSTDEALVAANLRRLQLRFYARMVPEDDEKVIAPLHELFRNVTDLSREGEAAHDGWLAVCIAMITDPEFILY